jgi:hypothetical protein
MRTLKGTVIIVQEGRFQVMDDQGVAHHFLLGHAAAAEPEQLGPLQQRQARVRVSYHDPADLIGHVATAVTLLEEG